MMVAQGICLQRMLKKEFVAMHTDDGWKSGTVWNGTNLRPFMLYFSYFLSFPAMPLASKKSARHVIVKGSKYPTMQC